MDFWKVKEKLFETVKGSNETISFPVRLSALINKEKIYVLIGCKILLHEILPLNFKSDEAVCNFEFIFSLQHFRHKNELISTFDMHKTSFGFRAIWFSSDFDLFSLVSL